MRISNEYLIDNHDWIMALQMAVIIGLSVLFILLVSHLLTRYKQVSLSKLFQPIRKLLPQLLILAILFSPVWKATHPFLDEPVGKIEKLYHLDRGYNERLVAITRYQRDGEHRNMTDTNIVSYDPQTRIRQRIRIPVHLRHLVEMNQQYAVFLGKNCDYRVFDLWHNKLVVTKEKLTEKLEKFRCRKYEDGVLYVQTVSGDDLSLDMHMDFPMTDLLVRNMLAKHPCTTHKLKLKNRRTKSNSKFDLLRPIFLYDKAKRRHHSTRGKYNVCKLALGAKRLRLAHHFNTAFGPGDQLFSAIDESDNVLWTIPIKPKRSKLKKIMARMVAEDMEVTFLYKHALEVVLLDAETGEVKQLHTII